MEYKETINELYKRRTKGIKLGLDRVFSTLERLGNPQKEFKSIHIAGTNGKGSVSKIIYNLLRAHGCNVGLFTSPHLTRFTERIVVNDIEISEDDILRLIEKIKPYSEDLTFFEYITVMAFLYFKEKNIEYAVLETGMGGRLDATNVVNPEISVITSIGFDHQKFLGNDIKSIAFEKAGIIKKGIPVVSSSQQFEVEELLRQRAKQLNSDFYIYGKDFLSFLNKMSFEGLWFDFCFFKNCIQKKVDRTVEPERDSKRIFSLFLPLTGFHQLENVSVALEAFIRLYPQWNEDSIKEGLKNVKMYGRLEVISHDPLIILDIAHNPHAAKSLVSSLKMLTDKKPVVVFGVMKDKDFKGFIKHFDSYAHSFFFTTPAYERALKIDEFLSQLNGDFRIQISCVTDSEQAFKQALNICREKPHLYLLCTGSSYLISEIKEFFGEKSLHKGLGELL